MTLFISVYPAKLKFFNLFFSPAKESTLFISQSRVKIPIKEKQKKLYILSQQMRSEKTTPPI